MILLGLFEVGMCAGNERRRPSLQAVFTGEVRWTDPAWEVLPRSPERTGRADRRPVPGGMAADRPGSAAAALPRDPRREDRRGRRADRRRSAVLRDLFGRPRPRAARPRRGAVSGR